MLPELKEIKRKRKAMNLTQTQLAKLSGISQSLIAKIESGNVVPSYEKGKQLIDLLAELSSHEEKKAEEIMTENILFVKETDCIKKAIELMEKHGLSQLPVLRTEKNVGLISEKTLVEKLSSGKINIHKDTVKEIIEEPLPVIGARTSTKMVSGMLTHVPAVLISKKGKIRGIITKSDLLKAML